MTYHQNWFSEMKELSKHMYVEIGDYIVHPIEQVENPIRVAVLRSRRRGICASSRWPVGSPPAARIQNGTACV